MCKTVKYACLEMPRKRRQDKRTENIWKEQEKKHTLNSWEDWQSTWNFIESEYNDTPSNNGLDMANPAFAFTTDVAKYIIIRDVPVRTCDDPECVIKKQWQDHLNKERERRTEEYNNAISVRHRS